VVVVVRGEGYGQMLSPMSDGRELSGEKKAMERAYRGRMRQMKK